MKVLLVKTSSLGDVVHALPAVSDAAGQGARFHWVVEEAFQAVPAAHPAVERVRPIAWRRWRRRLWQSRGEMRSFFSDLAGERYDLVVDSQGLIKSALVAHRARAPDKAGFSRVSAREGVAAGFYSRRVEVPPGRHAVERQRLLLAGALGYECDAAGEADFGLPRRREPGAHCLFLHGASWESKLWPETLWTELARLAGDAGLRVKLPWGNAQERARAERIAGGGGAEPLPALGLGELMGELAGARLAIGVDSGLAHLSAALGTPTLVLYGSTDSSLTGCRGRAVRNLRSQFGCSPCLSRACRYRGAPYRWRETPIDPPCYGELHPERVWAAARELMHAHRLLHI